MQGLVVGIDNGVSGAISYVVPGMGQVLIPTPVKVEQNYQKKAKNVTRIHHEAFRATMQVVQEYAAIHGGIPVRVVLEQPFVNPGNFVATSSSLRAMEATLVILEQLGIGYQFIVSKEWQKKMLPVGTKTRTEQKAKSKELGIRQFPHLAPIITKIGDADAIWIAEYSRLHL